MAEPNAPIITDAGGKREQLRRAKRGASALLAVAVAVFAAARLYPEPSWIAGLVRAAAEAAIVGGLADWFAVTALFRRPLGLPIPHTALIPSRKDDIGRALGAFVSEQFLAPDLLVARLQRENRAAQIARWLDRPAAAEFLGARIASAVAAGLNGANDAELRSFIAQIAHSGLVRLDLAPTIDGFIDALLRRGRHMILADGLLDLLIPALQGLREPLIERIGEHTGRFVPRVLDRKIGEEMVTGISTWLVAARMPDTDERRRFEAWLLDAVAAYRSDPDYLAGLSRAQAALLSHPAVMEALGALWDGVKRRLLAAPDDGGLRAQCAAILRTVGRLLQDSAPMQLQFNAALEGAVVSAIAPWRSEIGAYISDIVASWDGDKVADVIELQVGRDLQYIRVNGTLVGALIGAALYLIGSAMQVLL